MYKNDTIAALATPRGTGGISIVRISGPLASTATQKLIDPKYKHKSLISHRFYLYDIVDPSSGEHLDRAGVIMMYAPKSFTGEDIAEFHLHGGNFLTRRVLESIMDQGVRLADAGEFTRRAFLNGKMDLTQAEAILDLIEADNATGLSLAWQAIAGRISSACDEIRANLMRETAHLEAFIDFPEEDIPEKHANEIKRAITGIREDIDKLVSSFARGKIYRDGLKTVILGKPNVGKSSLLNVLSGEDRAIVTDVPGTTRDVIEETTILRGIPFRISDTAGIHPSGDKVEKIGVQRALNALNGSELILALFDLSKPLDKKDKNICGLLEQRPFILVCNKTDLKQVWTEDRLFEEFRTRDVSVIKVSTLEENGIDELVDEMIEKTLGTVYTHARDSEDDVIITKERHKNALKNASKYLTTAEAGLDDAIPLDLIAVDLRTSLDHIGEVTGHINTEEILDLIFSDFCIGK